MAINARRYAALVDFERVHQFLTDTYDSETLNSYLLPQYFEYAHFHSSFDHAMTHRCGLWEDSGAIVGVACYEVRLGECHLHTGKEYGFLLPELLNWAERELCEKKAHERELNVWITDKEPGKRELLTARGYALAESEPVKVFDYGKPFISRPLPEGFRVIDGRNADCEKLHACFWRGFDHGDAPDDDVDSNIHAGTAPRFDASLMTIAVAPSGEYACALGMWYDERNKYAYLEPLATVPKYRRRGLATICLTEAMIKTKTLGAAYCIGGAREFYTAIGFDIKCNRELWKRTWRL